MTWDSDSRTFDAIGQWRDQERGRPIDSTGELPGGEKFSGAAELVEILARRKQQFADALTRRMLTYALGRGLQPADRCAVEDIVKRLGAEDYRFSELVQGIVESEAFRMRRGEGDRS